MRKLSLTLLTLAVVGFVSAENPFRSIFSTKKVASAPTKCDAGICAEGNHCNEFGYCVSGSPNKNAFGPISTLDVCGPKHDNQECPSGKKCTEFGVCITDTQPAKAVSSCKINNDCASDHHCNEFHYCIPGSPKQITPMEKCGKQRTEQPDFKCPEGTHCNEFGWCIGKPTSKTDDPPVPTKCQLHRDCKSNQHCNEFHWCIPGAPSFESIKKCQTHRDCPAQHKCSEFNVCISGAPFEVAKCQANNDCDTAHHCNEFHFCIPGTPITSDGIHCKANSECASDHHCNEFHFCISGAPKQHSVLSFFQKLF